MKKLKRFFTVRTIVFVCTIVALGVVGIFIARLRNADTPQTKVDSSSPGPVMDLITPEGLKQTRNYWDGKLAEKGGAESYAELKQEYAKAAFGEQHLAAHMFGKLLYAHEGIDGIVVCDSNFSFGCYHSFFGAAISREGIGEVAELNKACLNKYGPLGTGCQHGIGHGLMEYFGPTRLSEALESCKQTTQDNPLFGCSSGVFMEYNVPIVLSDTDAQNTARTLDTAHPDAPCSTIRDSNFRLSCYYELAQWWQQSVDIKTQGLWCGKVILLKERESCLLGVGNMVSVRSEYNPEKVKSACNNLNGASTITSCLTGGAWAAYSNPQVRSQAREICAMNSECSRSTVLICAYMPDSSKREECYKGNAL